jgi:predicted alpha/beta superfamily hydrolase
MRIAAVVWLGFLATLSFGQVTIRIESLPVGTPPGATIYLAGNFNGWNPGSAAYALAPDAQGRPSITFSPSSGTLKFKFTRGTWSTVEGDGNGGFLPDRTLVYNGQPTELLLTIQSWEGMGSSSTAQPNVLVWDSSYYIPQLNRNRRIWVYLPPDYASAVDKRYPVLYMHDGQNLFDVSTAFAGEWKVDESLNALQAQGDHGCIVVGIDNGGVYRLDEYSPWVNPTYGGGQGEAYVQFITENLKPRVDSIYRTIPGRQTTGIMGSSMGGLISMYALAERQDIFSRAGIFSPAFWFAGGSPAAHTASREKVGDVRVYFLAGGQEPASVAGNMQAVAQAMLTAGFLPDEQQLVVQPDGQHSEWFWARAFPEAYTWLFEGVVLRAESPAEPVRLLSIFPSPAGDHIRCAVSDYGPGISMVLQIWSSTGSKLSEVRTSTHAVVPVGDLLPGMYVVRAQVDGAGPWFYGRFVR